MARVVASTSLNTVNPNAWYGQTTHASSTQVVVSDGYNTGVYGGFGFTYDWSGRLVGGTLTSYSEYYNNRLEGRVDQFSVHAGVANNLISANNLPGLFAIVQNGADTVFGSSQNDRLAGYNGNDYIYGGGGNDFIDGGAGHDVITVGYGNSFIAGGSGLDTVNLTGTGGSYRFGSTIEGRQFWNADNTVNVNLESVERISFQDGTLAFDLDGNAGKAYRLYQAAFDRTPDRDGLSYWVDELDAGKGDLAWMANNFLISNEFRSTYGTPATVSDASFLTLIYNNVLDRGPDQTGFNYWMDELGRGFSRERVLASFSESSENQANVADAIHDGIWLL